MIGKLIEQLRLLYVSTYATAATSTVTSSAIDTSPGSGQAYSAVLAHVRFGTAAADNTLKVQQSSDDGVADAYSDLEGTSVTVGASDEVVWVDIRPTKRYVKVLALRGTSSTADPIVALPYNARQEPVDNTIAGTIAGEIHDLPDEGTA